MRTIQFSGKTYEIGKTYAFLTKEGKIDIGVLQLKNMVTDELKYRSYNLFSNKETFIKTAVDIALIPSDIEAAK